jgi:hypothetical protein
MSHHYSGVDFGFPLGDARLDFCDLYAFPKPEDTNRSILIMDVHPSKALPEGATLQSHSRRRRSTTSGSTPTGI